MNVKALIDFVQAIAINPPPPLGIPVMSFLHSLKLWRVFAVLAFVALVSPGLAEAQVRDEPVEILDATQGRLPRRCAYLAEGTRGRSDKLQRRSY